MAAHPASLMSLKEATNGQACGHWHFLSSLHFAFWHTLEYFLPTWRLWKFPNSLWKLVFGWTTIQSDSLEIEMTWWFWNRRPLQPRILECIHQRFELLNSWCWDLIFPIFYVNISKCVAKSKEFYNKHLHMHHLDSILIFYNTCVPYLSFSLCCLSDILIFHLGFSE